MCRSSDFIDASAIVELEAFDGWNSEVSGGCSISGKHVAVADLDLLRLVCGAKGAKESEAGSPWLQLPYEWMGRPPVLHLQQGREDSKVF